MSAVGGFPAGEFIPPSLYRIGLILLFTKRWRACLRRSCEVAAENVDILRRFDMVYLAKVENVQTEQDRIAAIQALEPFIDELEKNDHSVQMSQEFLTLKRDIAEFIGRFALKASEFGIESRKDIAVLEEQIKSAQATIEIVGVGILEGLGLGSRASSLVASLKAQRDKKAENFRDLQLTLAALKKLEAPHLQSQLSNYQPEEPNINLMLERLVVFAEIWSSVSLIPEVNDHELGRTTCFKGSKPGRPVP
ncbi:hypothetical protein SERLA73DRAFT_187809 [Serpula lacrymans var. lacrymans S7.3]|uniref:Uncharacterized protein n=1 Tax=Serpula lacrymans var. lacrymans (strain S7.3) TaxID=936435 RepID=F8QAG6_SERL3|nr:hypothetical protein SERLA73DRAFT_187809 [Serpula lacrymans var. lacrymans S7.3]